MNAKRKIMMILGLGEGRKMAVQPLFCRMMFPRFVQFSKQHPWIVPIELPWGILYMLQCWTTLWNKQPLISSNKKVLLSYIACYERPLTILVYKKISLTSNYLKGRHSNTYADQSTEIQSKSMQYQK